MYVKGLARRGPTFRETLLVHAVARLALHPWITNIQASWVKLGPDGTREALRAGVNDLGGTLMNESISRSAGAAYGQELAPEGMEELIRSAGRVPRQRTTLYGESAEEREGVLRSRPPSRAAQPAGAGRRPGRAATARAPGGRAGARACGRPARARSPRSCSASSRVSSAALSDGDVVEIVR